MIKSIVFKGPCLCYNSLKKPRLIPFLSCCLSLHSLYVSLLSLYILLLSRYVSQLPVKPQLVKSLVIVIYFFETEMRDAVY